MMALSQLMDRELLYRPLGEDVYRFTHALVRATTYASLPSDECRRYHHRLGQALLQLNADREDDMVELLAQHFYRSVTELVSRERLWRMRISTIWIKRRPI